MNRKIFRSLQIIILVLIIAVTDKVIGLILQRLYFSQTTGEMHSLNYVLTECKADILIFGNSRAQHHYDTRIISSVMKMSCYNAGQDGGHSILLSYAQIKIVLKRYSPKMIIVEFSPSGIVDYTGIYERLSILLPYYRNYPEIRPLILLKSPSESTKLISAIYPFNSNIIDILRYNTNYRKNHIQEYKGYIPLTGMMNTGMLKSQHKAVSQTVVDINLINALENIMRLCKEKGVILFIVDSPWYRSVNEPQRPLTAIEKMSLEFIHINGVNYLDFSSDSTFTGHLEYFIDGAHLNNKGAAIFSNKLIGRLKRPI